MQIVINIDKQIIDLAKKGIIKGGDIPTLINAISNGIVLPKGHGRLIDADAILEEPFGDTYKDIDTAETIIEADEEKE